MTSTRDRWIRFLFARLCIAAAPYGLRRPSARLRPRPVPAVQFAVRPVCLSDQARNRRGGHAARGMCAGKTSFSSTSTNWKGFLAYHRGARGRRAVLEAAERLRARQAHRLNRRNARNDADVLGSITQQYLAYFSEANPKKRAMLLREYSPSRQIDDRDGAARRGDSGEDDLKRHGLIRAGAARLVAEFRVRVRGPGQIRPFGDQRNWAKKRAVGPFPLRLHLRGRPRFRPNNAAPADRRSRAIPKDGRCSRIPTRHRLAIAGVEKHPSLPCQMNDPGDRQRPNSPTESGNH